MPCLLLRTFLVSSSLLAYVTTGTAIPRTEAIHPFLSQLPWDIQQTPEEWIVQNAPSELELDKRNWKIPTSGLPLASTVGNWIFTNDSSWPVLANAAIRRMQTWYFTNTNLYDSLSWWQNPVVMLSYMDLDQALQDGANERVVSQILNNNGRGVQFMIDAYVDDQAWWGLASARAYELYGNETLLAAAEAIQSSDKSYWTSDCGGGILWLTYKPDAGKNTVTNSLQIALSARLYAITGKETYLLSAQRTLNWWMSWAYNPSTGQVYDTLTAYDCVPQYPALFTYNSGIIIGALVDLYTTTQNGTYLSTAQNIATAAIRDFSNSEGIMQESCEHDGPPQDDGDGDISAADGAPLDNLPAGCQSDQIMFKAILAQNLGYLYRAAPDPAIYNYLTINCLVNAINNMDSTFLFGEWWGGPFNKTLANQLTQGNALGLLSAGVAVNIAYRNTQLAAAGQPDLTITNDFNVPLPTGTQNFATNTALRRKMKREARATMFPVAR